LTKLTFRKFKVTTKAPRH